MPATTVIDLGVGNLGNVLRALRHVGAEPVLTADPAVVGRSRRLVLPGVGAFQPPREALRGELEAALRGALEAGARLLGICVGFQLLFEASEEHGERDGLGLLSGRITPLPASVPRPHIGWNRLRNLTPHPLTEGVEEGDSVYFVHGYAPEEAAEETVLATCRHGRTFPAIAGQGRILGMQFHPEKSSAVGLRLLQNFVTLPVEASDAS